MGRTNGKLLNFLQSGLMNFMFMNLQYDSEDFQTFVIELPRYEKNRDLQQYEKILKEWYRCNGKFHLYKSYSNGKAVFQAALKKSIYLVSLKKVGKKLRFRFATKEEAEAKRLWLKEKSKGQDSDMFNVPLSPSSEASSGYHSGSESPIHDEDASFLDEVLEDPYKYIGEKCEGLPKNLFDDLWMDQTESPETQDNRFGELAEPPMDQVAQELQPLIDQVTSELQPIMNPLLDQVKNESKSVLELNPIPVTSPNVGKKFFWRCKQKIIVDSATLLLICDREVVEDTNNTINEGQIFIPNDVWKPGVIYKLQKTAELGEKNFLFFSQESV